ncbi:MAG: tetratricopeptide repeat protein [Planctomycetota bacterium]
MRHRLLLVYFLVLLLALSTAADVITRDSATGRIYCHVRRFTVPYEAADAGPAGIGTVRLFYTQDDGLTWALWGEKAEAEGRFEFVAPCDGVYGFVTQAIDKAGLAEFDGKAPAGITPEVTVVVDTKPPQIEPVFPRQGVELHPGAHLRVRFRALDPNLNGRSAVIRVKKDDEPEFTTLADVSASEGEFFAQGDILFEGRYTVEVGVSDIASNSARESYSFVCTKTPKPPSDTEGQFGRNWLVPIAAPPRATSLAFDIDYQVSDIGGRPPAAVALWYTTDHGMTWKFYGLDPDVTTPFRFQAPTEGKYGFKLTSTTASGVSEPPPKSGTKPDMLTLVDKTFPTLMLEDPCGSESYAGGQVHFIRWMARDAHFGSLPISIYVSREGGQWELLAAELPNTGAYGWNVPLIDYAPYRLRIEARDQVGNTTTVISDTFYVISAASETRILGIHPSVTAIRISGAEAAPVTPVEPPVTDVRPTPPPTGVSEAEIEDLIDRATSMRMRGEYEEAEVALRDATERDRHNVKARNELGALLTEMGRQQEAVEILKDARALAPSNEDVLYNLAAAYYLLGRYDESAASFETLTEMSPRSESVLWSLAKVYYKGGRTREAREAWKRLIALDVPGSSYSERARRALATVEEPTAQ